MLVYEPAGWDGRIDSLLCRSRVVFVHHAAALVLGSAHAGVMCKTRPDFENHWCSRRMHCIFWFGVASGCTIVQRCGRGLRKRCISLIAPHIRSSWSLLPPVILPRVSHLAVAPGASRERVLSAECNTYPNHHVCPFRKRRHVLSLNPAADGEPW